MEVNLYTMGDSASIDTWSNLPYFFSNALTRQGVVLNRIDVLPNDSPIYRVWQRLLRGSGRLPCHDPVSISLIQRRIKREALRYPGACLNIFLTFSFTSRAFHPAPLVYYCDQTYELFCEDTRKRPHALDRWVIAHESRNLRMAKHIFTTGIRCRDSIRERCGLVNVSRLPTGINLEAPPAYTAAELISAKRAARDILFIGKGYHKRGVDILLAAFLAFNERNRREYRLHIVGTGPKPTDPTDPQVFAHGYLSKAVPAQLDSYLNLLRTARLFVMPMREGPIPGVIREAGLMYTPVLTTKIWQVHNIVKHGVNGLLAEAPDPVIFADHMHLLANNDQVWETMAINAHRLAGRYDWQHAAETLLETALGAHPQAPLAGLHTPSDESKINPAFRP